MIWSLYIFDIFGQNGERERERCTWKEMWLCFGLIRVVVVVLVLVKSYCVVKDMTEYLGEEKRT